MNYNDIDLTKKGSLTGKLLVATPAIAYDDNLSKSIIYILSNDDSGSIGVIVNKVYSTISAKSLYDSLNIEKPEGIYNINIHNGGPIDNEKGLILHSLSHIKKQNTKNISNNLPYLSLSSDISVLDGFDPNIIQKNVMFVLGYSSWRSKQLEDEISNSNWIVIPYSRDLVFANNNFNKWNDAVHSIGISPHSFAMVQGNA